MDLTNLSKETLISIIADQDRQIKGLTLSKNLDHIRTEEKSLRIMNLEYSINKEKDNSLALQEKVSQLKMALNEEELSHKLLQDRYDRLSW